jgi:coenzyme F420-reducing hydrogenase delta subunit
MSVVSDRVLKMYVFYCSNGLDERCLAEGCSEVDGITFKAIALPCSGKVDIPYLLKAFETGADGVVIVTCKISECQHLEGNLRAHKRAEAVESVLKEIGVGTGRMAVISVKEKEDGGRQVLGEIKGFFEKVRKLPQSCAGTSVIGRRESIIR